LPRFFAYSDVIYKKTMSFTMSGNIAKIIGVVFMVLSAASQALYIVEDNWLEVISDVYAFNDTETEIVGHGVWTCTGGTSYLTISTSKNYPHSGSLDDVYTADDYDIGAHLGGLPVPHSLPETLFSSRTTTDDVTEYLGFTSF
jgi:hypothetical protein